MPVRQCIYCERRFTRAEHLQRHVRSHTKEKPFKCMTCGKGYVREDTLLRHAKSHSIDQVRQPSPNPAIEVTPLSEGLSPDRSMNVTTPRRCFQIGGVATTQEQPQSTPISPLESVQHVDGVSQRTQSYDFNDMGMIEDDSALWNFNGDFLMSAMDIAGDAGHAQADCMQPLAIEPESHVYPTNDYRGLETTQLSSLLDMRDIWFTRWERHGESSRMRTPSPSPTCTPCSQSTLPSEEQEPVDDQYRQGLSVAIVAPCPPEDSLPSSDFLNLSVRMYLTCFNPSFPIIHKATFRPTQDNGFLFLSMASLGCLFVGSPTAVRHGQRIVERIRKVILASWDSTGYRKSEIISMIQAAIIGQSFAMLSGDARLLAVFEAFHGALISFARSENLLESRPVECDDFNLTGHELDTAWRKWARREELSRISLALKIQDAELSAILHQKSLLLHNTNIREPSLASSRVFSACSAVDWASAVKEDRALKISREERLDRPYLSDSYTAYANLEGIGVSIAEDRRKGRLDNANFRMYEEALLSWHRVFSSHAEEEGLSHLCLQVLWHWTYMILLVDFDQLERAIGRDGPEAARNALPYVAEWIATPNASRCMLHAYLLQKRFQRFRFEHVPAIHVHRCLFSAAIAWHCYIQYGPDNDASGSGLTTRQYDTSLPEFRLLGPDTHKNLFYVTTISWRHGATSSAKGATLCELARLLQRIKEWGMAATLGKIVARLIDAEPHETPAW